ncbi:hypothetical protein EG339_20050 [Chryseobacterium bernardetii]|uniref:Uncharacterized protein n=2 Tax=Chryseobacterium group TaxID=2782232 RepID=A0A3G6TBT9_9FLAO|nr:hypothetical protein EG339_20050 [Chryseobacterium bernardetii]AZB33196.1 hypothetical protein EG351_05905 [Chryseobacterium bernardetii]
MIILVLTNCYIILSRLLNLVKRLSRKKLNIIYLQDFLIIKKLFTVKFIINMKRFLSIIFITAASYLSAQTGINTDDPKATLDITAKKEALKIDGLLPPRLTLAELTAKGNTLYGAAQDGAIIYITTISGGGDTQGQREYIVSKGLYLFDAEAANNEGRWMCLYCFAPI